MPGTISGFDFCERLTAYLHRWALQFREALWIPCGNAFRLVLHHSLGHEEGDQTCGQEAEPVRLLIETTWQQVSLPPLQEALCGVSNFRNVIESMC